MSDVLQLESLGHLSYTLRASVPTVRRVAQELGIAPACLLNGVPHYDGQSCEKIGERLRGEGGANP